MESLPESSALKTTGGEDNEASLDSLEGVDVAIEREQPHEMMDLWSLRAFDWKRVLVGLQGGETSVEVVAAHAGDQLIRFS